MPTCEGTIQCHSCQIAFENHVKITDLKFGYNKIEGGTTVDYYCPACKDCDKLKNSDHTNIVSEDGTSVLVTSYELFPEVDSISTRVPTLHFGNSWRGRWAKDTEFSKENDDY